MKVKARRGKGERGKKVVFLGYERNTGYYQVYDPIARVIHCNVRDVMFDVWKLGKREAPKGQSKKRTFCQGAPERENSSASGLEEESAQGGVPHPHNQPTLRCPHYVGSRHYQGHVLLLRRKLYHRVVPKRDSLSGKAPAEPAADRTPSAYTPASSQPRQKLALDQLPRENTARQCLFEWMSFDVKRRGAEYASRQRGEWKGVTASGEKLVTKWRGMAYRQHGGQRERQKKRKWRNCTSMFIFLVTSLPSTSKPTTSQKMG